MVCRSLRKAFSLHLSLTLGICLALAAGLSAPPPDWSDEITPSLVLRGPDVPLAVLAVPPTVRSEKRGQSHPTSLLKHDRGTQLALPGLTRAPQLRSLTRQLCRSLPRRMVTSHQTVARASDEPSQPLLS